MSDSRTPAARSGNDDPERPPRYEQVIRRAEYIKEQPPEVWGPQQNAVVNAGVESAQAVEVSVADASGSGRSRTRRCLGRTAGMGSDPGSVFRGTQGSCMSI